MSPWIGEREPERVDVSLESVSGKELLAALIEAHLGKHQPATTTPMNLMIAGRGLHSSTFQLNVSAFYGIGGAFRVYLWGVTQV